VLKDRTKDWIEERLGETLKASARRVSHETLGSRLISHIT